MNDVTLKEAKRLHDLGVAVIWVRPKSKAPVESGWTTGERKTWNELQRSYRVGYNLGIRLGRASRIRGSYLACFDLDIRDASYREKALSCLSKVVQGRVLSEVTSGGGNGSRHLYFLSKEPFKQVTIGKEKGKWELVAYSEGRQTVAPPSTHPNRGKYEWTKSFRNNRDLVLIDSTDFTDAGPLNIIDRAQTDGSAAPKNTGRERPNAGTELSLDTILDVRWDPRVTEAMREAIVNGKWRGADIDDRSDFLLTAANSLFRSGLTESEVLGVLTDKSTFLGATGFDKNHANTDNRQVVARWVLRYTAKKAKDRIGAGLKKSDEYEAEKELGEWEQELQKDELGFNPEENGFYKKGRQGALKPDYDALLKEFEKEKPFKTLVDMRCVFRFNDTHYEHFTPFEIRAFAEEKFNPKPEEKLRSEFYHKVLANHVAHRSFFSETTEGKINFKNGVLDVDGFMGLVEHSPDYGFRSVLPYDFDPKAVCPRFEHWLKETMEGDEERIAVLQEYMGYIIRGGEYKYHKALWLQGTGRNGKSTFIDVLKALIGAGNYSTISIKALMSNVFMNAELDGKLANFSEETSKRELADSGPFKNLTGDGESSAQKKYGDPYTFRNRAKLIMTYNEKPDLSDLSGGMLSRPLIVPFERTLKEAEQDREIKNRLLKELPGIFNFALKGWERLSRQNGFTTSTKSERAKKQVENESCNVSQWVNHYIDFLEDDNTWVSVGELYLAYRKTERHAFNINHFGARLKRHSKMIRRFKSTKDGTGYLGVTTRFIS